MPNPYDIPTGVASSTGNKYDIQAAPVNNVQQVVPAHLQDYGILKPTQNAPIDFTAANIKPPPSNLPIGIIPVLKPILHAVLPELANANDAVVSAIAERSMKPLADLWQGYKARGADMKTFDVTPSAGDTPEVAQEKQQRMADLVMGFVNPSDELAVIMKKIAQSTSEREIGETIKKSFPYLEHAAEGLAQQLVYLTKPIEVEQFLRKANEEAFKLHVTDAAHGVSQGGLFGKGTTEVPPHEGGEIPAALEQQAAADWEATSAENYNELSDRHLKIQELLKTAKKEDKEALQREADAIAFSMQKMEADHARKWGAKGEDLNVQSFKDVKEPTLDTVQTKPELFQQTRSLEKTAGGGGFEPYKVAEIGKNFDESRLLRNPISVGLFDNGEHVVTSGHNRLEILRQAKEKGLLTKPDSAYMNITDYRGQGGLQAAIDESVQSNIASKSVKDINLLDLYIRGTIDESALKNALSFDEKKIKFFAQIAETFKANGLVDMWKDSVGKKLADLKGLDFGVMSERLNFVNGIAKKTGEAIRGLNAEQKIAVQDQVGKLIQTYVSESKKATLSAVQNDIARKLDVIKNGGFKNEQLTNIFGEIVTKTEVAKKVPTQAFGKLLTDNLKSAVLPEGTKTRLAMLQKVISDPNSMVASAVNRDGGLTANAAANVDILKKLMALSDKEFAEITGSAQVTGETADAAKKIIANAKAFQHQFSEGVQDIARTVGHEAEVGPVKSESRIAQKATNEYGGDLSKVRDANRAVIFIDDEHDVAALVNAVKAKFGPLARAVKSTLDAPSGSYKSVILNIDTGLGHQAEIQLTTPEMWAASHEGGGHLLYEQVRSKFSEWEKAQADMEALYTRADQDGKTRLMNAGDLPRPTSNLRQSSTEMGVPRSDALSGEKGAPDASAKPNTSEPSELTTTGAPSTSKYLGKDESAIPNQYTPERAIPQGEIDRAQGGVDRGAEQGDIFNEKRVSVGEGTQLPYEKQPKMAIRDTIPLPPSVGDIILKNGKAVPIERTPADALEEVVSGPEGKQWHSIVKGFMRNAGKDVKANFLDYYGTPEFVLEKLGLNKGAEMLQDAKDAYRTTLKKEFTKLDGLMARVASGQGHMQDGKWMQHTPQDSSRLIFQWLDGQEKEVTAFMSDEEKAVAKEVRGYLKQWADRLNLPAESRIGKYITHIFERGPEQKFENTFDDPELAAIMNKQVAGSVYDPFLKKRMGAQDYIQDTWRALDAYVKRASRKEAMDPALERIVEDSKHLDSYSFDLVKEMTHRINMRPTNLEKGVDNYLTSTWIGHRFTERPTAFIAKKIRSMYSRGAFWYNSATALRNLGQGANNYAKLGEKYTVVGYAKLFGKMASRNLDELFEQGILDDNMIQDRAFHLLKGKLEKLDPAGYALFMLAEKINRGSAYYGAKAKGIAEGLAEEQAIKYAKRIVRETQFAFGAVDTPVGLNDDVIKTITQFQSYNIKQTEFLMRMLKNREYAGLVRWTIASLGYMATVGSLFGMTAKQIIPTIGLGGAPTTSTLLTLPGLFSSDPQTKAKAQSQLQRNLAIMVPGGAQLRKSAQGAEAYAEGRDVTKTGKTRFNIDHDPATLVRALLFGKSALPQAQEYYANLGKPKKAATGGNKYNR